MIATRPVDIILNQNDSDFILQKQQERSYAYRKMWKNYDKINNTIFRQSIQKKFNLQAYEYQCIKIDIETQKKQQKIQKERIVKEIEEINQLIQELKSKKKQSTKTIKLIRDLYLRISYKELSLSQDITFGGKDNLKEISRLFNDRQKNGNKILDVRKIYQDLRIQFIHIIGEVPYKGNRHFDFHFNENYVIYKPNKDTKIRIDFKVNKNWAHEFQQLDKLLKINPIPITIRLAIDQIQFSYDLEKLNDNQFNKKEFFKEREQAQIDNPQSTKEELTKVFKKHKQEQAMRMLGDKLRNRYCSIDLNPEFLGIAILEKQLDNSVKIIDKFCYELQEITKKSGKSSDSKESIYLNNKRKFEISKNYKSILDKCIHYKVANFVMEDLNFKSKVINDNAKEFNRKTKNIWNLNFQQHLISKLCATSGMNLILVNPCYTSFIGNLTNNFFDPVNAAIEIGRRGINKYIKGSIYPTLTSTIIDTMICRLNISAGDVQGFKDCKNWKDLSTKVKQTKLKYRWRLEEISYNRFSKDHIKSKVYLYTFK